jgi:hypothetical protein
MQKFLSHPPQKKKKQKPSPNFKKPPQNLKMVSTCDKIISKKIFIEEFGKFFPQFRKTRNSVTKYSFSIFEVKTL